MSDLYAIERTQEMNTRRLVMVIIALVVIGLVGIPACAKKEFQKETQPLGEPIWEGAASSGKVVKGLQVSISMKKTEFVLDEPIPVEWQIKNIGNEERMIIWHELHYSPVVFKIGKKGEKKHIRDDCRRYIIGAIPAPPGKILLRPGDVKRATFNLRYFGLRSKTDHDIYEIAGLYSPKDAKVLAETYLEEAELRDVITDQIASGMIEIILTKDLTWLKRRLTAGEFWHRLRSANRLAPIIGKEEVLAELERMYPPGNTRHLVRLVDCMAALGNCSHVEEVLDMYESGGYAPYIKDYGEDMLLFFLRWGRERGVEHLRRYLSDPEVQAAEPGTYVYADKRELIRSILEKPEKRYFPVLIPVLDDKSLCYHDWQRKTDVRFCDRAALAMQKLFEHDWGFRLELLQEERDEIINRIRAEGTLKAVPTLRLEKPKYVLGESIRFWIGVKCIECNPIPKKYWNTCFLYITRPDGTEKKESVSWPVDGMIDRGWTGGYGFGKEEVQVGKYILVFEFAKQKTEPVEVIVEELDIPKTKVDIPNGKAPNKRMNADQSISSAVLAGQLAPKTIGHNIEFQVENNLYVAQTFSRKYIGEKFSALFISLAKNINGSSKVLYEKMVIDTGYPDSLKTPFLFETSSRHFIFSPRVAGTGSFTTFEIFSVGSVETPVTYENSFSSKKIRSLMSKNEKLQYAESFTFNNNRMESSIKLSQTGDLAQQPTGGLISIIYSFDLQKNSFVISSATKATHK
jgi:hypothetical protein